MLSLDSRGMTRRRFFLRDFWAWDDFASGRIRKLHPYTLLDPNRPWWRRKLNLGYLAESDIQEVLAAVNTHYQLPPPPELPESLTIKYGFRRSASLDRNGVLLTVRGVPYVYMWHEIRNVHITRMDPLRRDFKSLEIEFPDRTIELKLVSTQGGVNPTWRGAIAEEINEFLFHHLAANQIDTSMVGEPFKRRSHIEKKLKAAKNERRQFRIVMTFYLLASIGIFAGAAITEGVLRAVALASLVAIPTAPLLVFAWCTHHKNIDDLESLLNKITDGD